MIAFALIVLTLILAVGRIVGWAWPEMETLHANAAQARQSVVGIVTELADRQLTRPGAANCPTARQ